MKTLRIAVALIRIPRLFISLLLFPLALSFVLVYGQLLITGVFLRATTKNADDVARTVKNLNERSFRRKLIYGSQAALPPIQICRWSKQPLPEGGFLEAPPSDECRLRWLDVALHVQEPDRFNLEEYVRIFDGNVFRLHLCETCDPGIVVTVGAGEVRADTSSIWGVWVLKLARFNDSVTEQYISAAVELERTADLIGNTYLHSNGFRKPIKFTGLIKSVAVLMNISMLIIIALFLALKSHRKVLSYFAQNGALLPLVAATGNQTFYGAVWVLTLFRVCAFLTGAVPLTYYGFVSIVEEPELQLLFGEGRLVLLLWLMAAALSLGVATLIASIGELKHRHGLLSFCYKFLPLIICFAGSFVWALSFLIDGYVSSMVRAVSASVPIWGLTPILVAPLFKPNVNVLAFHCILATGLAVLTLKHNARWFAAHLEEL